jgi:hypothetical protein
MRLCYNQLSIIETGESAGKSDIEEERVWGKPI